MKKKGSHVGFVISFVLFITFIIFMYAILSSRVDFGQEKANSLNYVKAEIIERVSENLTSVSVVLNNPGSNCVELSNFLGATGITDRLIVRSDSGNILTSGISGKSLQVNRNENTFFRVYESEEFPEISSPLSGCTNSNYILGLSRDSRDIFESKVLELFGNYTENYEALKKDMKISPGDEFGFGFTYNNGTEIKTPEKNVTINVYAERTAIQYIKTDAARETGFMDVIVW